jgi:hypothetical protein
MFEDSYPDGKEAAMHSGSECRPPLAGEQKKSSELFNIKV